MIILPIVGRELLVASRRRGTYWLRVLAAAVALIFCGITLITLAIAPSFTAAGGRIFAFLSWVGLAFALLIGVNATADCLSREKREGTLGLLFLTDLKGFDVVFGKLAAASLTVFYGIVAMLPVLALPLMLGGVTAGEYARMALVWLNSLFFSVSAGMAVSALSHDERAAVGNSFAVLLSVTLALPLAGALLEERTGTPGLAAPFAIASPLTACHLAFEAGFVTRGAGYWTSLGVTHALGWFCLWLACRAARYCWHDKIAKPLTEAALARWLRNGARCGASREHALERNPVFWLLSRQPCVRLYPWILLATMIGIWLWAFSLERQMFTLHTTIMIGYVTHFLFKWWVATVACRNFAEDRESGAMESLLSTPLPVKAILRGAWLASRRLFGWPIFMLAVLQLGLLWVGLRQPARVGDSGELAFMIFANVAVFVVDCWALHWAGLLAGFKSRPPQTAVWKTILAVLALPWLGVWAVLALTLLAQEPPEGTVMITAAWMFFSLAADLFFGLRAKRRLGRHLRTLALMRLSDGKAHVS
jgi:ABC-type transport system involved in cytochrome c biogenesis permease component